MQAAFGTVIWIVCGASLVIAVVALLASQKTWNDFGKHGLVMDRDPQRPGSASAPVGSATERDAEIRELLHARNARRLRRGEPPLDVEAEFARLTAPQTVQIDPGLREEIRQLVVARNHRRTRAGKAPLDIDAEIEREIRKLNSH